MKKVKLTYYHKHPSMLKTYLIEKRKMPLLKQKEAIDCYTLYQQFIADMKKTLAIYQDKRFEITGIIMKIGLDVHHKPSIEISNKINGQCYALCIFPTDDIFNKVSLGDQVVVRANYLVMSHLFGIVMKHSELIRIEK